MFKNKDKKIFNTFLVYFVAMVCFVFVRIISSYNLFPNISDELLSVIFSLVIQVGIMFVVPFLLYYFLNKKTTTKKQIIKDVGFRKISFKAVLIALLIGVLAFILNIIVSSLFATLLSFFGYRSGSSSSGAEAVAGFVPFLTDIIMVAVLPAIFEEVLHRGFILHNIQKIGVKKSIIISSLLFAFIHFNINQVSYAFVVGIILGFVTIVSRSIWPAIIIHFVNNGLATYLSHAKINSWVGQNFYSGFNKIVFSGDVFVLILNIALVTYFVVKIIQLLIIALFRFTTLVGVKNAVEAVFGTDTNNQAQNVVTNNEKKVLIENMIENNSNINFDFKKSLNKMDFMFPREKEIYTMTMLDKVFYYGSVALGFMATLSTLFWGYLWLL